MSTIQVKVSESLTPFTGGQKRFEVNSGTLAQVLSRIYELHPQLTDRLTDGEFRPHPFVKIFVGDEELGRGGTASSMVHSGADMYIMSAVAGG
ncbi:hypothetical protein [Streptomyces sp. NPDC006333]|uniref:hypothetical protein n=1 Tax=Streptomyces sp. NPDC006333 TaxID=3156753 RepID=UPI0033A23D54